MSSVPATHSSEESVREKVKNSPFEPALLAKNGGENLDSMQKRKHSTSAAMAEDKTLAILDLVGDQSPHHPMHWPSLKRWSIAFFYCTLQAFVTLTSTTYVSAEYPISDDFPASTQVLTLGQSLFVLGTAVGPAFLGPLSDIGGRKWVYVASIALYCILNIGTAQVCCCAEDSGKERRLY